MASTTFLILGGLFILGGLAPLGLLCYELVRYVKKPEHKFRYKRFLSYMALTILPWGIGMLCIDRSVYILCINTARLC